MKKALHYLNHQQDSVESRSWEEIIEFYDELQLEAMTNLANYISANYAFGIYATTSMQTLCLAQTSRFDLNRNVLRVTFSEIRFKFIYIDAKKKRIHRLEKTVRR